MKLRVSETAFGEITDILSYIAADNPPAAFRVASQINHTIELVSNFPELGRVKYRASVRMLPVQRYPQFLLFYIIEGDEIVILNVRHARRRPWDDQN